MRNGVRSEKRPDHAMALAKHVGIPLRIAAKVDPVDREYFETQIEPLLDHPLVEYVGEITDEEKNDFLGDAYALVCPYDWPEPFGIVLIEALACGTPVLAYNRGSIPEVIENHTTGIICEDLSQMIGALESMSKIDRARCRENFERRFTVERMVQDYLKVYERQVEGKSLLPNETTLDRPVEHISEELEMRNEGLAIRNEELRGEDLAIRSGAVEVQN